MGCVRRHMSVSISIHALREEGDGVLIGRPAHFFLFLSTPSARRATVAQYVNKKAIGAISIHALREEGDHIFPVLPQQTA